MAIVRLNWGCGQSPAAGWLNSDKDDAPGVDLVCDIRRGLPLANGSVDYISSMHALPELPYPDLEDALWELRRVLKPEGLLRLGLPDLDKAICAYQAGDSAYFLIPDDVCRSLGGKFITQMVWFGRSRTLFTADFTGELLCKAGFRQVWNCDYHQTSGRDPEIVLLDNRPAESFFMEALK